MSLISSLMSLQLNRRRSMDAEYGMLNTSNRMYERIGQIGNSPNFGMNSLRQLQEQEKRDLAGMHRFSLMRKLSNVMAESAKKMVDRNIKSFDFFA